MPRKRRIRLWFSIFVYTFNIRDNSLDRKYVVESESSRHIIALCIYNAHRDGRFTWHVPAIFISRAITWNTRGVAGNTYYRGNICKSLPRDIDVGYSPFASLFRTTFFHLQSPCHPAPFPPLSHSPFLTGRAASHRIYGTYGGRYVLWLIVLLSLTYFQFTAAARHFASWLSIVRDERRFMCHPGLYLSLRPPRILFARRLSSIGHDKRHFLVTKKKSVLSHRREKKNTFLIIWFAI